MHGDDPPRPPPHAHRDQVADRRVPARALGERNAVPGLERRLGRGAATRGHHLGDEDRPRPSPAHPAAAARPRAFWRASSGLVSGSLTIFTAGGQAPLGEVVARGGQVALGGELQRPAVAQQDGALDERLAERALADERAPLRVAQRAGDDLAGARAVAVDQHVERQVARDGAGVGGERVARRVEPLGDHDGGVVAQEGAGHPHGLGEQAARVAAQVEDERLSRPARAAR